MEEKLILTGSVKLTRQDVTKAINEFLAKQKGMDAKKVIYQDGYNEVICKVEKHIGEASIPEFKDEKQKEKRNSSSGWTKKNKGIFRYMKDYFEDHKGNKLTFSTAYDDLKFHFPELQEKQLKTYLYNKKQFPSVRFKSDKMLIEA